ncbi:MAG: FAD-dependent oxidoreductase [Deltaproteobacteria bacterium]|nr:FAD-dependent oxidoreductase [Deltaproteobacteria bacterium]
MSFRSLLSKELGRRELLTGNEAIVRGAIEAGVGLVSGYPGTPASEVGDTFRELASELGISFEYSVNEKVALELAFGASLTGCRSLVSMKHLGLSYASDPLSTIPYIGVVGGMVIVSAADPGCLTSPNEQDQRHLGRMMGIPTLDPSSPEEAREMTVWAFELSERSCLPVLLRTTTRVCHTRAPVVLGEVRGRGPDPVFRRDPQRFVPTPVNARRMRQELSLRLDVACDLATRSPFNPRTGGTGRRGVIATGAARASTRSALARAGTATPLLELGTLHPLPHELILPFLRSLDSLLVVEELTPYLEDSLLAMAHHHEVPVKIHGKRDGKMPWPFELSPEEVEARVRAHLELPAVSPTPIPLARVEAPPRPPWLCAGCPHRNTFFATTSVFGSDRVYVNDIGCYTLGASAPHEAGDVLLAMGSSLPLAAGISRATKRRVVAFMGDSTFFHSGMPPLLDCVAQDDDVVLVVMDNRVTAMTGLQPSPTSDQAAGRIAAVARALGATDVTEVRAHELEAMIRALERVRDKRGFSVIVSEGPCALLGKSQATHPGAPRVNESRCHTCGMAETGLHCGLAPARSVQQRLVSRRAMSSSAEVPRTSPCSLECPLGICIPAYVGAIAAGDPERALAAVELRAALPSVCSHLCHRPCEDACIADGRAIAINELKRYLTESSIPRPRLREAPKDARRVAVVGGGPAGLAAARELARRGYATTVFDAHDRPGGMLAHAIPELRLPRHVLERDLDAVFAEGVRFEGGVRFGRDLSWADLRQREFEALVLALGAEQSVRPVIPGSDLPRVDDALEFLRKEPHELAAASGVGGVEVGARLRSAPYSARALDGESVLVLGGGDVAFDVARVAKRRGAASALLVFPEPEDQLGAAPDAVLAAQREGIGLMSGHVITAIEGRGTSLVAMVCAVDELARGPEGPSFRILSHTGSPRVVDRVVFAIGQRPVLSGLPEGVVLAGRVMADEFGRTSAAGVFVAGDFESGPSTVTQAMASGVRTAAAVDEFLSQGRAVAPPAAPPRRVRLPHSARRKEPREPERGVLQEVLPYSPAEAVEEASRCLLCGLCANCNACTELFGCPAIERAEPGSRPRIAAESCTSCGACLEVCPNQAIGWPS